MLKYLFSMPPHNDCVLLFYSISIKRETNARITTIIHEKYSCKLIGSIPKTVDT